MSKLHFLPFINEKITLYRAMISEHKEMRDFMIEIHESGSCDFWIPADVIIINSQISNLEKYVIRLEKFRDIIEFSKEKNTAKK